MGEAGGGCVGGEGVGEGPWASCDRRVGAGFGGWGFPGLWAGTLAGFTRGTAAGATLRGPGQEQVQAGSYRGGVAVFGPCLQVSGQQAEGLDVVPGGGGGDGPDARGQAGGPLAPRAPGGRPARPIRWSAWR